MPAATQPAYQLARPAYDPIGIRLGNFMLFPAASENAVFDDNIFASEQRLASDFISTSTEQLTITSQTAPYDLRLHFLASQELYAQHSSNNGYIWDADTTVRAGITRDAYLQFEGAIAEQPLARGTAEAGEDPKRAIFNRGDISATYGQTIGAVGNRLQFVLRDIAYVSEGDRSRSGTRFTYRDRLSYDIAPNASLFLEGSFAQQQWKERSVFRNFNLLTGVAGVSVELPGMLEAEISLGAVQQTYRDSAFKDLVTPVATERLIWNVTPLTSIILTADRAVFGTETFPSGAVLPPQRNSLQITTSDLGVQHEFIHNLLGEVRFGYERDHFDFNGLTDRTFVLRGDVRYLINRFLEADLEYVWRKRIANLPADRTFNSGPFSENVVSLTLKAGL